MVFDRISKHFYSFDFDRDDNAGCLDKEDKKDSNEQLKIMLIGQGVIGKSTLLNTLFQIKHPKTNKTFFEHSKVVSYTNNAAQKVLGETIHKRLDIKIVKK